MLETDLVPAEKGGSSRLMVVLHGLGDSMEGYRWLPEALNLPWLNYLLVNAPDEYYGGFSWYDLYGNSGPGIERSRNLLLDLLERLPAKGFAADQTLLFGFSQGCLMTVEVGTRFARRLAGCIGISGYVQDVERVIRDFGPVAREQAFLATHGTADPLLPIGPVRQQFAALKAAGLPIEWHEFDKVHTIAGEAEMAVIREFVKARWPGSPE